MKRAKQLGKPKTYRLIYLMTKDKPWVVKREHKQARSHVPRFAIQESDCCVFGVSVRVVK